MLSFEPLFHQTGSFERYQRAMSPKNRYPVGIVADKLALEYLNV